MREATPPSNNSILIRAVTRSPPIAEGAQPCFGDFVSKFLSGGFRAGAFHQEWIDSIGDRVALSEDPGNFPRLPVDDARQDQVQAAPGSAEPRPDHCEIARRLGIKPNLGASIPWPRHGAGVWNGGFLTYKITRYSEFRNIPSGRRRSGSRLVFH
jgi:hypothetical protein